MADENLILNIRADVSNASQGVNTLIKLMQGLNQEYKHFIDLTPKATQQAQILNQTINNNNQTINNNTSNIKQNNTAIQNNTLNLEQNNKSITNNTLNVEQNNKTTNKLTQELTLNTKILNDNRVSLTENTKIIINYRESVKTTINTFDGWRNSLGQVTSAVFGLMTMIKAITTENAFIEYGRQVEVNFRGLNAIALETEDNFQRIQDSVLKLADKEALASLNDLSEGLYQVYSSGYQGAEALNILTASNLGAGAGLASTKQELEATIAVLHSYGYEASKASEINNIFLKTVQDGVVTLPEFSRYIGQAVTLAPAFKKANGDIAIGIEQISAAIVGMTRQGLNMAESTTAVNQLLKTFIDPAKEAKDLAKELQIELSPKAFANGQTLADVLGDIINKTNGIDQEEILGKLFGNIRALKALFKLAKDDASFFKSEIDALMSDTSAQDKALEQQRMTFDQHVKALNTRWEVAMQSFFKVAKDMALPVVEFINKLVQGFNSLDSTTKQVIATIGVTGGALVGLGGLVITTTVGFHALSSVLKITSTELGLTATTTTALSGAFSMLLTVGGALLGAGGIFYGIHEAAKRTNSELLKSIDLFGKLKAKGEYENAIKDQKENEERNQKSKEESLKKVQELLRIENELKAKGQQLTSDQNREMAVSLRNLAINASTKEDEKRLREQASYYEKSINNHKQAEKKKAEVTLEGIEKQKQANEEYEKRKAEIESTINKIGKNEYELKKQSLKEDIDSQKQVLLDKINFGKIEASEKEKLQKQLLDLDKHYNIEASKLYKEYKENQKREREQAQKEASDNLKKNIETQIKELQATYQNKQNTQNTNKLDTAQYEMFEINKLKESNDVLEKIKKKYQEIVNSKIALPDVKAEAKKDYEQVVKQQLKNIEDFNKSSVDRQIQVEKIQHDTRLRNIEIEKAKKEKTNQEILQLEFNDLKAREAKLNQILKLDITSAKQREQVEQQLSDIKHQINLKAIEKQKQAQEQAIKEIDKQIETSKNSISQFKHEVEMGRFDKLTGFDFDINQLKDQKKNLVAKLPNQTKEDQDKTLKDLQDTNNKIEQIEKDKHEYIFDLKNKEISLEEDKTKYLRELNQISENEAYELNQISTIKKIENIKKHLENFIGSIEDQKRLEKEKEEYLRELDINRFNEKKRQLESAISFGQNISNIFGTIGQTLEQSSNQVVSSLGKIFNSYSSGTSKTLNIALNAGKVGSGDVSALPALISDMSNELANSVSKSSSAFEKMNAASKKGTEGIVEFTEAGQDLVGSIPLIGETLAETQRFFTDRFNLTKPKTELEALANQLKNIFETTKQYMNDLIGESTIDKAKFDLLNLENEEKQKLNDVDKTIKDTKDAEAQKALITIEYAMKKASAQKKIDEELEKNRRELVDRRLAVEQDEAKSLEDKHIENLRRIEQLQDNSGIKELRIQEENQRYNVEKFEFEYKYAKLKAENLNDEKDKLTALYLIDVSRAGITISNEKIRTETLLLLEKKYREDLLKLDKKYLEDNKKLQEEYQKQEKEAVENIVDFETDAMKTYFDKLIDAQQETVDKLESQINYAEKKLEEFKKKMDQKSNDLVSIKAQFDQQRAELFNKLSQTNFFDYSTAGFDEYQDRAKTNINYQYQQGKIDPNKLNQLLQEQSLKEQIYYQYKQEQAIPGSALELEYQKKAIKAYEDYVSLYQKNIQLQVQKQEEIQQEKIDQLEKEKDLAEKNIDDLEKTQKQAIENIKRDYKDLTDAYQLALMRANTIWHDDTAKKLKDLADKLKAIQLNKTTSTTQTGSSTTVITNPVPSSSNGSNTSPVPSSGGLGDYTSPVPASSYSDDYIRTTILKALQANSPTYPYSYFEEKYGPLPIPDLKQVARERGIDGYIPNFSQFADGGVITKPTFSLMGEKEPEVIFNQGQISNALKLFEYIKNPDSIINNSSKSVNLFVNFTGTISASNTSDLNNIAKELKNMIGNNL